MDPVVDYARPAMAPKRYGMTETPNPNRVSETSGARYAGRIDGTLGFGGKVLEMQRPSGWTRNGMGAGRTRYPGMGPGKLRPAGDGLFGIDHSLAEVWFDLHATDRLHLQWGLGSVGMGPGTRNLLWNADMAPAPYLLIDVDLGRVALPLAPKSATGLERLPADGGGKGGMHPWDWGSAA